jgi:hypothetical protein
MGATGTAPEPIETPVVESNGSTTFKIGIVAIVIVIIYYVLRLKKN